MINFSVAIDADGCLPAGTTDADALLTVRAEDDGAPERPDGTRGEYVEVIVIDCSGSMSTPATKLYAARRAACAAVDSLRPGTLFAVIRGTGPAQVDPTLENLLARGRTVDGQEAEFPTGAWGAGCRSYHLAVSDLVPHRMTRPSRLARVAVVSGGRRLAGGDVQVLWTEDERPHTQISQQVRHSRGVIDLTEAINRATAALRDGDTAVALAQLTQALRLARANRDQATIERLRQVVETDSAGDASRLIPDLDPYLLELLDLRYRSTQVLEPRRAP